MAFDEAGPKDHTPPPPPGTVGAGGAGGAVPLSGVDDTSLGGIHFVRAAAPTREAVHAALAAQGIESGDWGVTRTDGSEDPARLMATAKGAGDCACSGTASICAAMLTPCVWHRPRQPAACTARGVSCICTFQLPLR